MRKKEERRRVVDIDVPGKVCDASGHAAPRVGCLVRVTLVDYDVFGSW